MAIVQTVSLLPQTPMGSLIGASQFGINLVYDHERFGTASSAKFDEVQAAAGMTVIRPGGADSERLFDYAHPNATTATDDAGVIHNVIPMDDILDYCKATHSQALLNLPVRPLLTSGAYGSRDFDVSKTAEVRAFIAHALDRAGPGGISAFDLGNEYESYMTSKEYGRVASSLALIAHQEIEKYSASHPGQTAALPDIAVQVWGQSAGGSLSLDTLAGRNRTVMAEFNAQEMAAVSAVDSHFYYAEGANAGQPNVHAYANIAKAVGYSLSMMNAWSTAAGRALTVDFSEWNVNFNDTHSFGLKQIPFVLELFTAMVEGGATQMNFWSALYHPTSLANAKGELQAAGTLFQVMSHDLIGMKATEIPQVSASYDVHAFSGHGTSELFISSLSDTPMALNLDLGSYLQHQDLVSARLMAADLSKADGVYQNLHGLSPWEEPDVPILLLGQSLTVDLNTGLYATSLAAHQTLVLVLKDAATHLGTAGSDTLTGDASNNQLEGLGAADSITGLGGNDLLYGGAGNDTILGGDGADRIWGGVGSDSLFGDAGNDTVQGMANCDVIHGGAGQDYLSGGDGADTIWGDAGADQFVFRAGESGADHIMDFSTAEGDGLVFEGGPVTRASFQVTIGPVAGLGVEASADITVRLGPTGPVIWLLADAGHLSGLQVLDASSGHLIALI